MASTIKLTFLSAPIAEENISISIDTGTGIYSLTETFKSIRSRAYEVSIAQPDENPNVERNRAALNYLSAWNLDYKNYGSNSNLTATTSDNTVTITLNNTAWQFTDVVGTAINSGAVSFTITNGTRENPKAVSFTNFEASTNVCSDAKANLTATGGTESFKVYVNNVLTLNGVAAPFQLTNARGSVKTIRVTDSLDALIGELTLRTPRKFIEEDISIEVDNLESGATVSIDTKYISNDILPLTYSLDGTTYKSENIYSGLANDSYTLYVKDAFGCVTTKDFVVDGQTSLAKTVFTISDVNALRFAKFEEGKKNHLNTLSCNELRSLSQTYFHRYTLDDVISTQFKTNAQYINAYTLDREGATNALSVVKHTTNIGNRAKSTCTLFNYEIGKTGVYFGAVDMVDYDTNAVLSQTDFGFTLPEWANTVGQYVNVEGIGEVKIDDIGYSEFYDAFVLVLKFGLTETSSSRISATYNIQPYEVYQFDVAMSLQPEVFNVVIEVGSDAQNISHTYISEKIKRVVDSDRLFEISYWDSSNKGDMVYQTGIVHKLRLEGMTDYLGEQDTEGYNGDTEYYVTDNSIYNTQRFYFPRLSNEMAHKLRMVVAHEKLIINGVSFKLSEAPEVSGDINNNFKTFSVTLKQGGDAFLESKDEIINGSADNEALSGAVEASRGKALLLWTKSN
jgi:hypothetical protein